ncbi:hypothetical protein GYN67_10575 [Lactococcus piscium]|uniref:hypothetical protein n=1 Tax=Pseudolactococcus carnosus TaxID=2749961 RepID=UPI001FB966C2|nr:hypothetical protein [Lactococcus carnosus]MCJ1997129.1 hypothetical protein [Lactococcus carnosus]
MLQKWGWAFISVALLIFISTLQGAGAFLILSILVFILGLGMVFVGSKKDKAEQNGEPKV